MAPVKRPDAGVRRSPFLVTYWSGGDHRLYDFSSRVEHRCTPLLLAILEHAGEWISRASVAQKISGADEATVFNALDAMERDGLLESTNRARTPGEEALASWRTWNPAAGYFHAATRTAPVDEGPTEPPLLSFRSFPPALKEYPGAGRIELPRAKSLGNFGEVLKQRRTWREFAERNLTLDELATLLGLTFGVQEWMEVEGNWLALKTSPSGGARHSIEAYVLALGVDGLEVGTYHYAPDAHALRSLDTPTSRALLTEFIPKRAAFRDAPVFIVLTSVFARMQYKYPHPHAYRVVLLDAGHLGQTFALVATALGLAPYCSAAINAPAIEQHLSLDGISEAVVLGLGVGARPPRKDWSPMHDHSAPPRTKPATRPSGA